MTSDGVGRSDILSHAGMINEKTYDVAIAGGGLAGLTCSILLAKKGYKVALFERDSYPFHKVCGEYISLESWGLLTSMGLPLSEWNLPVVDTLCLSSPSGKHLTHRLPLGGFGISRYKIDEELARIARQYAVDMYEGTRVHDISFTNDSFSLQTDKGLFTARTCSAATGKRSNLDVKWKRPFTLRKPNALNNYIAVKYHAQLHHPRNLIELHNFNNGYCGIAPVEDDKTCICYLTTAENLRNNDNDIKTMEQRVLFKNPVLRHAFENAVMLYDKPLVISQVSFDKKEQVCNHVLMTGDAAGLIAPLCGNGMSMALFSGKMSAESIDMFLSGKINRKAMEEDYTLEWKHLFSRRLLAGRIIQSLFGGETLTNNTVRILKKFPSIITWIIRQTHGKRQ